MAKILPILGELTGSVAGSTFARSGGGSYVKARASPTNGNTTAQQRARSGLGRASAQWAGLSQTNKDLWADAARQTNAAQPQGVDTNLTAHQCYCAYNAARIGFGGSGVSAPPTAARPGLLTSASGVCDATTLSLTFAPASPPNGGRIVAWQGPAQGKGRTTRFSQARFLGRSPAGTVPQVFTLAFPMLVGQQSAFWVAIFSATNNTLGPFRRLEVTRLV